MLGNRHNFMNNMYKGIKVNKFCWYTVATFFKFSVHQRQRQSLSIHWPDFKYKLVLCQDKKTALFTFTHLFFQALQWRCFDLWENLIDVMPNPDWNTHMLQITHCNVAFSQDSQSFAFLHILFSNAEGPEHLQVLTKWWEVRVYGGGEINSTTLIWTKVMGKRSIIILLYVLFSIKWFFQKLHFYSGHRIVLICS